MPQPVTATYPVLSLRDEIVALLIKLYSASPAMIAEDAHNAGIDAFVVRLEGMGY